MRKSQIDPNRITAIYIRWMTWTVCFGLILFKRTEIANLNIIYTLFAIMAGYNIITHILLRYGLIRGNTYKLFFDFPLSVDNGFDLCLISIFVYSLGGIESDFFLLYLVVIVFNSVYRKYKGCLLVTFLAAVLYLLIVGFQNGFSSDTVFPLCLRIAFFFITFNIVHLIFRGTEKLKRKIMTVDWRLASLTNITKQFTSTFDIERVIRFTLSTTHSMVPGTLSSAFLRYDKEKKRLFLHSYQGSRLNDVDRLERKGLSITKGIVGATVRTGKPILVPDVTKDSRYLIRRKETRSELCVPVKGKEDVLGVINLESERLDAFSEEDRDFLVALSEQAAIAMENARYLEQILHQGKVIEEKANLLEEMVKVGNTIVSDINIDEILNTIASSVSKSLGFGVVAVGLVDGKTFRLKGFSGVSEDVAKKLSSKETSLAKMKSLMRDEFKISNSFFISHKYKLWEKSKKEGKAYIPPVEKIEAKGRWHPEDTLVVPLKRRDSKLVGMIQVDSPINGNIPDESEVKLLELFANQGSVAIQNAQLFSQIKKEATQLSIQYKLSKDIVSTIELNDLLKSTVYDLAQTMGYHTCGIILFDRKTDEWYVSPGYYPDEHSGWVNSRFKISDGAVGKVIRTGKPMLIPDTRKEKGYIAGPFHTRSEMIVPLITKTEVIGAINVENKILDAFTEEDIDFLSGLAGPLAIAIENAELFKKNQQRIVSLSAAYTSGLLITQTEDRKKLVEKFVETTKVYLDYYYVGFFELEDSELVMKGYTGAEGVEPVNLKIEVGKGLVGSAAETGKSVFVNDINKDARYVEGIKNVGAEMAVPVKTAEKLLGVLDIGARRKDGFSSEDLYLAELIAKEFAVAYENANLLSKVRERAERLAMINEVGRDVLAMLDIDKLFSKSVEIIQKRFGYGYAEILIPNFERKELVVVANVGKRPYSLEKGYRQKFSDGIVGWVYREGKSSLVNDTRLEPRYLEVTGAEALSELTVPIKIDGRVEAILDVGNPQPNSFTEEDRVTMETIADQLAIAMKNALLYEQIRDTALHLETMVNEATADLVARNKALQLLHQHQETIIQHMPTGLLSTTEDGEISVFNKTAEAITGYREKEVVGKDIEEVFGLDVKEVLIDQLLFERKITGEEIELPKKDGTKIPIGYSTATVTDEKGEKEYIVMFRDLSAMRKLEQQLLEREKLAAVGKTASTFAHELQNVLSGIIGSTELLAFKFKKNKKAKEIADTLIEESTRVSGLIEELLTFTHPMKLDLSISSFHKTIVHALNICVRGIEKNRVRVVKKFNPQIKDFAYDKEKIGDVFAKLIENSVQAMKNSGTLTITTDINSDGDIVVDITDTGDGIAEENIAKIFSPFFTTRLKRVGLGLAVAKRILDLHEWDIEAESKVGKGTTMRVRIPCPTPS